MKCPNCAFNQKYKSGMTCGGCGYRFALDPKKPLGLTDAAFKAALDRLSGGGQYFFTQDQLYAQIYRVLVKKKKPGLGALSCLGVMLVGIGSTILVGALERNMWTAAVLAAAVVGLVVWLHKRPVAIPAEKPMAHINAYKKIHGIDNLVDGTRFRNMPADGFDAEFLDYAPERILIVDRNDTVDMLLLNRFHFEHKTLVVSAEKYPAAAFAACRRFLSAHPDLPVFLAHDCSETGIRMQSRLLTDPEWGLDGRHVTNLGLHPKDVERLKTPMWVPENMADIHSKDEIRTTGAAKDHISRNHRVPLGVAGPGVFLGTVGLAMATGMAMLSDALLAEQQAGAAGRSSFETGFG